MCHLLRAPEFERFNATPILVLSATYAGDDLVALTRDLGADGFLEAPFAAAREAWRTARPHVVLLGHHLPDGTSEELLATLADLHERTSVLVMTGDPDPFLPVRLFSRGADGYLRKPFEPRRAVEHARSVARQRALLRIGSVLQVRHREQQALERSLHNARRLESLGLLAGGIAHEFNNLLAGIMGHADLALLDLEEGSPARSSVAQIASLARRAAERTRQILVYAGEARLVPEELDLADVVAAAVRGLDRAASGRVVVTREGEPPRLRGGIRSGWWRWCWVSSPTPWKRWGRSQERSRSRRACVSSRQEPRWRWRGAARPPPGPTPSSGSGTRGVGWTRRRAPACSTPSSPPSSWDGGWGSPQCWESCGPMGGHILVRSAPGRGTVTVLLPVREGA